MKKTGIELSMIMPNSTDEKIVKWSCVPRVDEIIVFERELYLVRDIWHSMELGKIRVFLKTKPL